MTTEAPSDHGSDRRQGPLASFTVVGAGILALLALGVAVVLIALDFTGGFLTSGTHAVLSAYPLALIAISYLAYQSIRRMTLLRWLKVAILAAAFLLWAAYQLFPNFPSGPIFNDIAIGLFVLDVALIIGDQSRRTDWA